MFTRKFWKAAAERATKTAGQAAVLAIGADQLDALHADWRGIAGFALGGAVLSVATSLASIKVGNSKGPSVTGERLS